MEENTAGRPVDAMLNFYNSICRVRAKPCFDHKGGGDPVVRPKAKTALFHGLNYIFILLLRERNGCFICHSILQGVRI